MHRIALDTLKWLASMAVDVCSDNMDRDEFRHLKEIRDYAKSADYPDFATDLGRTIAELEAEADEQDADAQSEWEARYN